MTREVRACDEEGGAGGWQPVPSGEPFMPVMTQIGCNGLLAYSFTAQVHQRSMVFLSSADFPTRQPNDPA